MDLIDKLVFIDIYWLKDSLFLAFSILQMLY